MKEKKKLLKRGKRVVGGEVRCQEEGRNRYGKDDVAGWRRKERSK